MANGLVQSMHGLMNDPPILAEFFRDDYLFSEKNNWFIIERD
jgi:hypothetical protein